MDAAPGSTSSRSAAHERASRRSSGSRGAEGDGAASEMHMSIDSQSFVNLGQLMGSRHGTAGGGGGGGSNSNSNAASPGGLVDDLGTSCLSDDDSEGLRDFDQILHPRAEQGGSASSPWSSRALYGRGSATDGDDDDDESLLPALPSRSTTPGSPRGTDSVSNKPSFSSLAEAEPGWVEEDFESDSMSEGDGAGGARGGGRGRGFSDIRIDLSDTATGTKAQQAADVMTPETQSASLDADDVEDSITSTTTTGTAVAQTKPSSGAAEGEATANTPSFLRDSWLHIPVLGDDMAVELDRAASAGANATAVDGSGNVVARVDPQRQRYHDAAAAAARARRAAAVAVAECGDCVVRAVDKASVLAASRLQQVARVVKEQAEAGADACARGQQVVVQAVDNVPQAPVRMWLVRIAASLLFGAVLGGGAAYFALPRGVAGSASPCTAAGGSSAGAADSTPLQWDTRQSSGAVELDTALFAAKAEEVAAQQVLLEEVRNVLAATGKSGGISAEQILRQFNARRFMEASKARSAAEGNGDAGSDPLDSLSSARPGTPPTNPSAPPPSSSQQQQPGHQQQQQQQQQEHQRQPQPQPQPLQQPFVLKEAAPATDCAGGAAGSTRCSQEGISDLYTARAKIQQFRRPCPGGWVC